MDGKEGAQLRTGKPKLRAGERRRHGRRIGVIADIHGNLEALEAALEALGEVDSYVCLGDIVGYGANPNECCERVLELGGVAVLGNHDAAILGKVDLDCFNDWARAALEWTLGELTHDNRDFLASLPQTALAGDAILAHGSLTDPWEYITFPSDARSTFEQLRTHLCFVGHTHVAQVHRQRAGSRRIETINLAGGGVVRLAPSCRYILNPGSVGQPRDGNWRASAAIYDTGSSQVEVVRVPYKVAAAQNKITAVGLPPVLSERLRIGR